MELLLFITGLYMTYLAVKLSYKKSTKRKNKYKAYENQSNIKLKVKKY
jgi:hypothetical protein